MGQPDFTHYDTNRGGDTGPGTLNEPYDITVDSTGRLWVADATNNRVIAYGVRRVYLPLVSK